MGVETGRAGADDYRRWTHVVQALVREAFSGSPVAFVSWKREGLDFATAHREDLQVHEFRSRRFGRRVAVGITPEADPTLLAEAVEDDDFENESMALCRLSPALDLRVLAAAYASERDDWRLPPLTTESIIRGPTDYAIAWLHSGRTVTDVDDSIRSGRWG